ncbi:hypothetical protein V2A60_000220 [Cordyceps javanica]
MESKESRLRSRDSQRQCPEYIATDGDCAERDPATILGPVNEATWKNWIPNEVLELANATPRTHCSDLLAQINARSKDPMLMIKEIAELTGLSLADVLDLSHYGYNNGWMETVIKGRVDNAKEVAEDSIFMLFAELQTADTAAESEWYTDELRKRATIRLLQHFCGTADDNPAPVVLSGTMIGTKAKREPFLRKETALPNLERYFWLRYVDSGVLPAHVWAASTTKNQNGPVDLRLLAVRNGLLANDLNDTVTDAIGTGLNFVLAAYANGYCCAGTFTGLVLRGGIVTGIRHERETGDIQPLLANILANAIHLWGPRYATGRLLRTLVPVAAADSSSYVLDSSWPPQVDSEPELLVGYADVLRNYAGTLPEKNGAAAYYLLLEALQSESGRGEVERATRACVQCLASEAEQGLDPVAWGAISDLSIGRIINPNASLPLGTALLPIRGLYAEAYRRAESGAVST